MEFFLTTLAIFASVWYTLPVSAFSQSLGQACKQCELHEHLSKNSEEYHNTCKANLKGSAPAMETDGVVPVCWIVPAEWV